MKTLLAILKKAGGWRPSLYVKIENPPYMPLVIEAVDESGPLGLLKEAATTYKVDTDAIAQKVKAEFAAKAKAKKQPQPVKVATK